MGKSQRLRVGDLRAIYQLLGECRELGDDPTAWRRHLLAGVSRRFDAAVGLGGEGTVRHPRFFIYESEIPAERSYYVAALLAGELIDSPMVSRFPPPSSGPITRRREHNIPDREWYRSSEFNELFRRDRIDGGLMSIYPLSGDDFDVMTVHTRLGRRLGRRETRLAHLLHREVGPLVGGALAGASEPGLADLSPRLRQTLDALLEGEGEKQVAARLGLCRETVHVYVKALYRHFRVSSRAELLAHFLRRHRAGRPLSVS